MKCPVCERELLRVGAFCPHCGAGTFAMGVKLALRRAPEAYRLERRRSIGKSVLLFFAGLGLVGLLTFGLRDVGVPFLPAMVATSMFFVGYDGLAAGWRSGLAAALAFVSAGCSFYLQRGDLALWPDFCSTINGWLGLVVAFFSFFDPWSGELAPENWRPQPGNPLFKDIEESLLQRVDFSEVVKK